MQKEFLIEVLNVMVIPSYIYIQKVVTSYDIILTYRDKTYIVNGYYIFDGEKGFRYRPVNNSMGKLIRDYVGEEVTFE